MRSWAFFYILFRIESRRTVEKKRGRVNDCRYIPARLLFGFYLCVSDWSSIKNVSKLIGVSIDIQLMDLTLTDFLFCMCENVLCAASVIYIPKKVDKNLRLYCRQKRGYTF